MASGGRDRNAKYALSKLFQMGTGISAYLLKSFYIFGLKLELQRELFRSRPTTLREAFFLARIADAYFEDERSTIANAKPHDLNAKQQANVKISMLMFLLLTTFVQGRYVKIDAKRLNHRRQS
ncbi:hypothetical protein Tco_0996187 [Tanacetum coccineum]